MPPTQAQMAYRQPFGRVLAELESDAQRGLSEAVAGERLARGGENALSSEPPISPLRRFAAQFQDVLVVLLLIATVVSLGLWLYERDAALPYEAAAIFAIVLLNALMGYLQEARAQSALNSLRKLTAARSQVVRDGRRQTIASEHLVVGDILLLEEGDTVPADARLIEATALQSSEAPLTGESLPVSKQLEPIAAEAAIGDRKNMVFRGTSIAYGRGRAVVVATGMHTEMGRIAGLLRQVPAEVTPLQRELDRVGKLLGLTVVAIAIVMIATIILAEHVRGFAALTQVLILGVALAVAAVPEGLPAIVTVVLSLGVARMARRNAIVRHLRAVETLGSADVICSDKTGTLTKNEMSVRLLSTASGRVMFEGSTPQLRPTTASLADLQSEAGRALTIAERANNAVVEERDGRVQVQGDPTEGALIVAARAFGLDAQTLQTRLPRRAEIPFSSERKRMSTLHADVERPDHALLLCKGAPDVVLSRCRWELRGEQRVVLDEARREAIAADNAALAGQGLRTLGLAFRELSGAALQRPVDDAAERDLVFVGIIGMLDPPRPEARQAVARARAAGIRSLMITGDHPATARMIARELTIAQDGAVVTGAQLTRMNDAQLVQQVAEVPVFARVDPEHKLRIVRALQQRGAVVAMTGDGVNDAPALKMADIGVAMGITGTDVSKDAADMVLADDNFASIVAAVEEGRAIFSNIRKFLRYLLSSNIGEVMTMFFGVLLAEPLGLQAQGAVVLPLLATQLLWINLVTDGAPALALGIDPGDAELMSAPPRRKQEGVLTARMWRGIVFVGAVMALASLAVLDASLQGGLLPGAGHMRYAQTMAFTTLVLCQMFNVLNARSDVRSAWSGLFRNPWLWGAIGLSIGLQVAVVYVPVLQRAFSTTTLSALDWLRCAAAASSVLFARELTKWWARARSR